MIDEFLFWIVLIICVYILKLYFSKKDDTLFKYKEELFKIVAKHKKEFDLLEIDDKKKEEVITSFRNVAVEIDRLNTKNLEIYKKELEKNLNNFVVDEEFESIIKLKKEIIEFVALK